VQIQEVILILNVLAFTGEYRMRVGMSPVVGRYRDHHLLTIGKVISEVLVPDSVTEGRLRASDNQKCLY
jgi:hypothetical protein